jgi:hypothetical protein
MLILDTPGATIQPAIVQLQLHVAFLQLTVLLSKINFNAGSAQSYYRY